MAAKCTICGQTIDAGDGETHTCRGEPAYQSDLRELIALAQRRPGHEEHVTGLDAPASVREAIRLSDGLLPAPRELPQERPRDATEADTGAARRRAPLVLVPVIAVAAAGALFAYARSGRSAATTSAPPPSAEAPEPSPVPVIALTLDRPEAPVSTPEAQHASPLESVAPAIPKPAPATAARPLRPRPQPVATPHHPRAAATATPPPAESASAASEPPSLMQAITEAVRAPKNLPRVTP
jgi:hypothetical protein